MKLRRMRKVLAFSTMLIGFVAGYTHGGVGGGKEDTSLSKTITKSFLVPKEGSIRIVNKYGPIVINTWNKDSLNLKIVITAWGKSSKNVDKMMSRVDFDFNQSSRYLELKTVLDRSSGFFAEIWNNIGDYSKTLLSQNKLKIEYTITMPEGLDLEIENKFGDIYFQDYSGKLKINLSHGNIHAARLSQLQMGLSFGNANIKSIRDADLTLKATECDFLVIGSGEISSSSSEILISEAGFLKIDSRSDRRFVVRKADEIQGTSTFSKIVIGSIADDFRMDFSYGDLKMGPVISGFSSIDIRGSNTPISIEFDKDVSTFLYLEGREDRIKLFGIDGLEKKYLKENENIISLSGNTAHGTIIGSVRVRSGNAEIELMFD